MRLMKLAALFALTIGLICLCVPANCGLPVDLEQSPDIRTANGMNGHSDRDAVQLWKFR